MSNAIIQVKNLVKKYGDFEAVKGISFDVMEGEIFGLLGPNGAGKTTLLRILAGVDSPDTGVVEPGHGAVIGYYAQEHETLDPKATVLQTMNHAAPHLDDTRQRTVLGSFLFEGDAVLKPTGVLSGGEKILITFSAGVAQLAPGETPEAAIERADRAMYLAKRAGKNRVLGA